MKCAWDDANAYYLGAKSKRWGVLVKDTCENYTLENSLSKSNINYTNIHLYRHEYKDKVTFPPQRNDLVMEGYYNITYNTDDAVNILQQYLVGEGIQMDNLGVIMEIEVRDLFDNKGNYKETQNLSYVFEITPNVIESEQKIATLRELDLGVQKKMIIKLDSEGIAKIQ